MRISALSPHTNAKSYQHGEGTINKKLIYIVCYLLLLLVPWHSISVMNSSKLSSLSSIPVHQQAAKQSRLSISCLIEYKAHYLYR